MQPLQFPPNIFLLRKVLMNATLPGKAFENEAERRRKYTGQGLSAKFLAGIVYIKSEGRESASLTGHDMAEFYQGGGSTKARVNIKKQVAQSYASGPQSQSSMLGNWCNPPGLSMQLESSKRVVSRRTSNKACNIL